MLSPIAIGIVGLRKWLHVRERTTPSSRSLSSLMAGSNGFWSVFALLQPGDEGHRHANRCDHLQSKEQFRCHFA